MDERESIVKQVRRETNPKFLAKQTANTIAAMIVSASLQGSQQIDNPVMVSDTFALLAKELAKHIEKDYHIEETRPEPE